MCHWSEMYWETYMSDQSNIQTVIFFLNLRPRWVFGQNGIDVTWNNHQNVKLVKHDRSHFYDNDNDNDNILFDHRHTNWNNNIQ